MDVSVGEIVITNDGARWQVYSITRDGLRRSFVALHLTSSTVLAGDVAELTWSEGENAWRVNAPGRRLP